MEEDYSTQRTRQDSEAEGVAHYLGEGVARAITVHAECYCFSGSRRSQDWTVES